MKILKQLGHQGDCQFFIIDAIPTTAKKINKTFVAESERSGSMHALCGDYEMYVDEDAAPGGFIIDAKTDCILNHSLQRELASIEALNEAKVLPKKDHRHSVLPAGKYVVGIQQRFDPLSAMKERVRD